MDKELKIFALDYIQLHDHLIPEEKLVIAEFVMEASDEQVEFLLVTGQVKDKLTKEDLVKVEGTWDAVKAYAKNPVKTDKIVRHYHGAGVANVQAGILGLGAAAIVAAAALTAMKVYKSYFSKAAKACKGKFQPEKGQCMKKFKVQAQKAKITSLSSAKGKCGKSKDAASCKSKLDVKIAKEKAKLQKMGAL